MRGVVKSGIRHPKAYCQLRIGSIPRLTMIKCGMLPFLSPRRFALSLLAGVAIFSSCSDSKVVSESEFTSLFAAELRKAAPELQVVVVEDLELKVITEDGREMRSFLDNAYGVYKQDPPARDDTIRRYVSSGLETYNHVQEEIDRTKIVPIIKDRPWLEETRRALLESGVEKAPENVFENFNEDLAIVYAEDSPKNIRYLSPEDLNSAKLNRSELRELACANLKRLLPKMEKVGGNGVYMITAGGDYDASLLLFDSIWDSEQWDVRGDIVVAVPARDLLLVTGSKDRQGIKKVKNLVEEASAGGSYRLTKKLFVRREGKFQEFTGAMEN